MFSFSYKKHTDSNVKHFGLRYNDMMDLITLDQLHPHFLG